MRWSGDVRLAWTEAVASTRATPVRFAVLAALIALLVGVAAWREGDFAHQIEQRALDRQTDGEFVFVARATPAAGTDDADVGGRSGPTGTPPDLPASSCDALVHHPGVVGAGTLAARAPLAPDTHPSGSFSSYVASSGYRWTLMASLQGPPTGVVVGQSAADELGLIPGSLISVEGDTAPVLRLTTRALRDEALSRSVVLIAPAVSARGDCHVEVPGLTLAEAPLLLPSLLGTPVSTTTLLEPASLGLSAQQVAASRPDTWLWVGAAVLPTAFGFNLFRSRRTDFATYTLCGATRPWMGLMRFCEFIVCSALAPAAVTLAVLLGFGGSGDAGVTGLLGGLRQLLAVWLVAALYCFVSARRAPSLYESLRSSE